ncbi:DNA-binding response regulator [Suicoccus acidiformans]|uniref:DNA-binding response regulator n=1 Tax=Suicoccus acidiformans TaxID=2036206 RepID=A0A347WHQ7_9LACT|nr:response regulator transcription factor [Suicoccus acidiformans]AXY24614.1 DNA-binding response regulator [Suicoccus acidiformans]
MNILLIDDHKMLTESLKMLLELDDEVAVVDVINSPDNLQASTYKEYDIILLDLNFGEVSDEKGLTIAKELLEEDPSLKIIIITGNTGPAYEFQAKQIGASGFFDKSLGVKELLKVVKGVYSGREYFSERFTTGSNAVLKYQDRIYELLTKKEVAILRRLWQGETILEIADNEGISKRTVSNHINHIYDKLDVQSREQAIRLASQLGYFDPE